MGGGESAARKGIRFVVGLLVGRKEEVRGASARGRLGSKANRVAAG